jgi:hypothetical protein
MAAQDIGPGWPVLAASYCVSDPDSTLLSLIEHQFEHWGCGVGPHCSFCGTFTGPFSEIEGLFTVLICIPCLEVRLAQPDTLLGLHAPGQPWAKWGSPIKGCGQWFSAPGSWRDMLRPRIRAGRRPTSLLRPYPNQRQRVVYRRSLPPAS